MQSLKLDDKLFPALESGRKKVTVRKGKRNMDLGELTFESHDQKKKMVVEVNRIYFCKLKDIDQQDVRNEGFYGKHQLMDALKSFYPDINMNSIVTVFRYEPKIKL